MFKYACRNINKWLSNNIQLHFIMKHFNMTQWPVLCPHNHVLKTTTTTGDIRELSSHPLLQWTESKLEPSSATLHARETMRTPPKRLSVSPSTSTSAHTARRQKARSGSAHWPRCPLRDAFVGRQLCMEKTLGKSANGRCR